MQIDAVRFSKALGLAAALGAGLIAIAVNRREDVRLEPLGVEVVARLDNANPGIALGPADARVTVTIFGDYQCPACRHLDSEIVDSLSALARSGRLRLVYVSVPLPAHRRGALAGQAVRCAGAIDDQWKAHRALYEADDSWGSGPSGETKLRELIVGVVSDTAAFARCFDGGGTSREVEADIDLSRAIGILSVPTIFVDFARVTPPAPAAILAITTARAMHSSQSGS